MSAVLRTTTAIRRYPTSAAFQSALTGQPLLKASNNAWENFRRSRASSYKWRWQGRADAVRCALPSSSSLGAVPRWTAPKPFLASPPPPQQQQPGTKLGNQQCRRRRPRCYAIAGGSYYRVLQLTEGASFREVKAAYRRAVRRCHPDVDPSPEGRRRFDAIATAYAVLSKPTLRSIYDKYGTVGVKSFLDGRHPQDWTPARKFAGPPSPGEDVKTIVEIPLEDAVLGGNVTVAYESQRYCGACQGSGYRAGAEEAECELCRGSGAVTRSTRMSQGDAASVCPCPDCGGAGVYVEEYCDECVEGRRKRKDSVGVKIPAGILTGSWIKLGLRGDVGKFGGASGDLYIGVQMARHSSIHRCGDDLYSEMKVSFLEAILGGAATVGTITAEASRLTIPRGTQHGAVLEIKGAGAPVMRAPSDGGDGRKRGSHFFQVSLLLPTPNAMSAAELDVLHRLRALRQRQRQRPSSEDSTTTAAR